MKKSFFLTAALFFVLTLLALPAQAQRPVNPRNSETGSSTTTQTSTASSRSGQTRQPTITRTGTTSTRNATRTTTNSTPTPPSNPTPRPRTSTNTNTNTNPNYCPPGGTATNNGGNRNRAANSSPVFGNSRPASASVRRPTSYGSAVNTRPSKVKKSKKRDRNTSSNRAFDDVYRD